MFARLLVASVGLGLLAIACGSSEPEASTSQPAAAPTATSPAEQWAASEITDYTMTYTSSCGDGEWIALDPVTVRVEGATVTRVSGDEPGKLATVANMFGLIDAARAGSADRVDVEYGPEGQPMRVDIDHIADAIDDELCFDVSSFEVTK